MTTNQIQQTAPADYHDPHVILGLHQEQPGQKIIRLWRPGAQKVYLELFGQIVEARKVNDVGLFEYTAPENTTYKDYRVYHQNGLLAQDPYAFTPTFGEIDQHLFAKGVHYQLYDVMGARLATHQDIAGVKFAVWAPSARSVAVVGDFNFWDGRVNPMRSLGFSGVWEIFIPGLQEGMRYKFEIKSQIHDLRVKSDPYAYSSEVRPFTASVVAHVDRFHWEDQDWMNRRFQTRNESRPMNVYEVHLGSWRKHGKEFLNYREIAAELATYCKEMNYTHIELMPISEHPLDESWGYQVTGYYAITSRFGTPEDFQYFVNYMHKNNIGVIVDWVPGHFPTDDFSLARFDGTALYEHEDPRQGYHPHWSTYIFNFGRREVSNFMIANALFFFDKMHVDGLRVDAVASMLYLDYGREAGQWIPNQYGGKENLESIEFLKHLNSIVHERYPGILTIAEESTSFTGVTHPVSKGGLGFDLKWNMGWMNDTLRYFAVDPLFRCYHQSDLTFGLIYAFSEKFDLVLSHDEIVHGKKSLINKMPGDVWQKFANLRLLLSYMICQPGKKLLFMGGEFAQWNEWYCKAELDWNLLQYPSHNGVQKMVKELNKLYLENGCLWEKDYDYTGFEWVDFSDQQNSVISYLRKGSLGQFLCVHNFTPQYHPDYFIRINNISQAGEVFNSDAERYWGSGKHNHDAYIVKDHNGHPIGIKISLPPLATVIFQVNYQS